MGLQDFGILGVYGLRVEEVMSSSGSTTRMIMRGFGLPGFRV